MLVVLFIYTERHYKISEFLQVKITKEQPNKKKFVTPFSNSWMILFELPEYLFNFRHIDSFFHTYTKPGDLVLQSFHGSALNTNKSTVHLLFSLRI